MKRSRFTEEQIIGVLREQEAGLKVGEVWRKHGISEPTFYAWQAKFGGMSISDAKRLKRLEEENAKLKKLLAEAITIGVTATQDSIFDWREVGAQVKYPGRSRRISVDLDMLTFNRRVVAAMLELEDADAHTPQDPNLQ